MLRPEAIGEIPAQTVRVAKAAFPKGSTVIKLRDAFGTLYQDEDFALFFSNLGQPALAPWRLALVTVFQFLENLSDRQAADVVRGRLDWKYALGLELEDPGFDRSVLSEFQARLAQERGEQHLLTKMLEHFREAGLLKVRGHARTDSTHVLASVRQLHKLENITNWGLTQFRTRYKDDTINGVKVLLDTHTFLWFIEGDSRIGSNALAKFSSPSIPATR